MKKIVLAISDKKKREEVAESLRDIAPAAFGASTEATLQSLINDNSGLNLLIIDMRFEKKDARPLMKRLRKESHFQNVPMVILSDKLQMDDIDEFIELGAAYFVPKPINHDMLHHYCHQILGEAASGNQSFDNFSSKSSKNSP